MQKYTHFSVGLTCSCVLTRHINTCIPLTFLAGQDFRERYLLLPSCDRQSTCLVRRQNPGYGTIHSGRGAEEDGKG
eukprot:scaffold230273_cov17-Tisochrysis_lutea.AAC.1